MLLGLALIGGNAHARLHLIPTEQPASHGHDRHNHAGQSGQHKHQQDKGLGCCCDCLGCVSAYTLTPEIDTVVPMVFGTTVHFGRQAIILHGRVLLPEPKPPRPIALT
jgi:hypothetical protein